MLKKIIAFSLLAISALNANPICSQFKEFKEFNGHYYALSAKQITFDEALQLGANSGGYIAIPNDNKENDFISSLLKNNEIAWIGIYDKDYTQNFCYENKECLYNSTRFKTVSGQYPIYSKWGLNQPDNLIRNNDIDSSGKALVKPLGEHWVGINKQGMWADYGNHISNANNPIRYYAVFEWNEMPYCYNKHINLENNENIALRCSTMISDGSNFEIGANAKSFLCEKDKKGIDYCPYGLERCENKQTLSDGISIKHYDYILVEKLSNGLCPEHFTPMECALNESEKFRAKKDKYGKAITRIMDGKCEYLVEWQIQDIFKLSFGDTWEIASSQSAVAACRYKYDFYEYSCGEVDEDKEFEVYNKGGNCTPQSIADLIDTDGDGIGDSCNEAIVPKNNCAIKKFVCPSNPNRECVQLGDDFQCSEYPCFESGESKDTSSPIGSLDKNNQGWNSQGLCEFEPMVLNGIDNRCRSEDKINGINDGGCCNPIMVGLNNFSCDEAEKKLARQIEEGLCYEIGSYCANGDKDNCIETKSSYCCFNSKAARLVVEQGKIQLNKNFGLPTLPDCSGLNEDDLKKIDFSKIRMEELVSDFVGGLEQTTITAEKLGIKEILENTLRKSK